MVEAAGQLIQLFRVGRTMPSPCPNDPDRVRSVLSIIRCRWILVPAPCDCSHFSRSMSLYRAGLKLAFFLPLGVAIPLLESGFADVSSVVIQPSRADATL